jgi:hypothetical protein
VRQRKIGLCTERSGLGFRERDRAILTNVCAIDEFRITHASQNVNLFTYTLYLLLSFVYISMFYAVVPLIMGLVVVVVVCVCFVCVCFSLCVCVCARARACCLRANSLLVFRPFNGEVLVGTVHKSTIQGIWLEMSHVSNIAKEIQCKC